MYDSRHGLIALALIILSCSLGCGGAVANESAAADAAIDVIDASDAAAPGTVRCGTTMCTSGEVCAVDADGSGRCYARGTEPLPGKAPFP